MSVVKSGIYGLAVGDALGVPVEFQSRSALQNNPIKTMIGYGSYDVPKGTWSDDTSMTLAEIDAIIQTGNIDYFEIMNNFLKWCNGAKYTATGVFFDIGITTRRALQNYSNGINPVECGGNNINTNGNGSLMRILPFVFYAYYNNLSEDEVVDLINDASSLTHAHEISRLGCKIYSDYVFSLLDGLDKYNSLLNLKNNQYEKYYSKEAISYYKRILSGQIKDLSIDSISSSGFVVDSLEASIWCNLTSKTYEEAVSKAVNLGDDTDTIGAITGSIAGVLYGYETIPNRWLNEIKNIEYLEELTQKFENKLENQNKKIH